MPRSGQVVFAASTKELTGLILADPAKGSQHLDVELLPRLDAYLALADAPH